ncbi:beta-carotene 15,15'-monooxygenase [Chryseobacterium sp. 6424]|uniref:beta-carotene 15,15'-monooxygenase n=1 Tax=Chryseobacterium sp. 6424 TaxID=2039166 RepID=UPI000EFBDDB5|nr:beta-carotene 15,15'-monooxygenase [Chryseobacterium sp. 6424]AYO58714.1 beta-carotene 15,15'-monooxygenase [Chryseobacterium sp. 6424]
METYETINPGTPRKSTNEIISHAFETYKGVFLYGLLAMVIYVVVPMLVQPLTGFDSKGFSEEIISSDGDFGDLDIWAYPGMKLYYGVSGLVSLLLAPIFVGLLYMANKYDSRLPLQVSDLFIGYRQNFLNIIIYSFVSSVIMGISFAMCVLPFFFVLPFLFLAYPILLFENASFVDAMSKSFRIAKNNYGVLLLTSLLALIISLAGILLCGIGIFATLPFYMVVIYSAYCAFCGKPRELNQ